MDPGRSQCSGGHDGCHGASFLVLDGRNPVEPCLTQLPTLYTQYNYQLFAK